MGKLLLSLNSLYLGMGAFFSLYVAPTLFKVLEKGQAGKVVERVFPVHFGLGFLAMVVSMLLGWKFGRFYSAAALLNSLIHGLQLFYVLPKASSLKTIDYTVFMKWHGISMGLNLVGLILTLVMIILLAKRM